MAVLDQFCVGIQIRIQNPQTNNETKFWVHTSMIRLGNTHYVPIKHLRASAQVLKQQQKRKPCSLFLSYNKEKGPVSLSLIYFICKTIFS